MGIRLDYETGSGGQVEVGLLGHLIVDDMQITASKFRRRMGILILVYATQIGLHWSGIVGQ